jgi:hypothetical protein
MFVPPFSKPRGSKVPALARESYWDDAGVRQAVTTGCAVKMDT